MIITEGGQVILEPSGALQSVVKAVAFRFGYSLKQARKKGQSTLLWSVSAFEMLWILRRLLVRHRASKVWRQLVAVNIRRGLAEEGWVTNLPEEGGA